MAAIPKIYLLLFSAMYKQIGQTTDSTLGNIIVVSIGSFLSFQFLFVHIYFFQNSVVFICTLV